MGLDIAGESDWLIDGVRIGGRAGRPKPKSGDFIHPSDHPLGYIGSAGMMWTWADGYIFRRWTFGSKIPKSELSLPPGQDTCFRNVDILWDVLFGPQRIARRDAEPSTRCLQVLHGDNDIIDPEVDGSAHGGNLPLALRWVDLYQDAWALAP